LSTLRVVLANLLLAVNGPTHCSWQNATCDFLGFCGSAVQFTFLGCGAMAL